MFLMLIKDLRFSPMRTLLTGFSMFIGIVAVILSVLVGTIGNSYLAAINEQFNGRETTLSGEVSKADFSKYENISKLDKRITEVSPNSGIAFTPTKELVFTPSTFFANINSEYEREQLLANSGTFEALYVTSGYKKVFNLPMYSGKWLSDVNGEIKLEVVINKSAYQKLSKPNFIYVSAAESKTLIPVPVIGVVNDGRDDVKLYFNAAGLAYFGGHLWESGAGAVYIHEKNNYRLENLKIMIVDSLYDTTGGELSNLSPGNAASVYKDVAKALQIGFTISAALLLFLAALGLINIGLATLEQRAHELLIRRAMGATRAAVVLLVLGGALLLAIVVSGAAIGVSFAVVYSAGFFLPHDTPIPTPEFPITAAIIATASSISTALIGGVAPAIQAARLQPALALR